MFNCTVTELLYVKGSSNKFYRVYDICPIDGSSDGVIVLQWGRRGTVGQSKTVPGVPAGRASHTSQHAPDRYIRVKTLEGYEPMWEAQTFTLKTLPSAENQNKILSDAWDTHKRDFVAPTLESLKMVKDGVHEDPFDTILVLEGFQQEVKSEIVAKHLHDSLPNLQHCLDVKGLAVLLPASTAWLLQLAYFPKRHFLKLDDASKIEVTSAFLEVMMGVWTPTDAGMLQSIEGAYKTAEVIL